MPSTNNLPPIGWSNPINKSIKVDFPEPVFPTKPTKSALSILRFISLRAKDELESYLKVISLKTIDSLKEIFFSLSLIPFGGVTTEN